MSLEDIEQKLGEILAAKAGAWKTASIIKGGTISDAIDLGGNFAYLQVVVPTIDSAQLELQVGETLGGPFQDFGQNALTVAGTGAFSDTWVLGGWRFIKIKASAAQSTADRAFRVRGVTY